MEITPKERLYWLLSLYKDKKIDIPAFCNEFHSTFDHELNETLSELEYALFKKMALIAGRFSELEEDHIKYPGVYFSSIDVDDMVQKIIEQISL